MLTAILTSHATGYHCSSLIYDIWIIFWRLDIIESNWWYFQSPGLVYPQCNEVPDWHLQRCSQRGWIQLQIVEKDLSWHELRNVFHIFRVTPCTCASQNTFVIATTWSRPEENNYVSSENILETTSAVTRDTWLPVTNKGIASTEYTLCCNILPVATSWLPAREIVFFPPLGRKCGNLPRVSTIHVPSTALLSGGLQSWHRCYKVAKNTFTLEDSIEDTLRMI